MLICVSFWRMTGWTPDVDPIAIVTTIVIQGAGLGFVFTPLQVLSFSTLSPSLRTDGASLFSLLRNIGAAIGVSVTSTVLSRNTQTMHEIIGAGVTPFNRAAAGHGAVLLDGLVNQQARIVAYANDYKMLIWTTLPAIGLLLLMRQPARR
jgi:MFS transporter, DHA2 family, multidrug resistance protein